MKWFFFFEKVLLTHFSTMFHFYTPWKRQKTFGFLAFSGGIEMEHSVKMVNSEKKLIYHFWDFSGVFETFLSANVKSKFIIERVVTSTSINEFGIKYVVRCAIWYHFYNLKNVKNTHGGVMILVKLQASACSFTEINTPPWVYFMFLNCTNGTKSRNGPHISKSFTWHLK